MGNLIRGYAKKDKKTKNLIHRLKPSDIAVIIHRDLDEVAALHLVESKVKAVINCDRSISGRFPNQGPLILFEAGIPLYDNAGLEFFEQVKEGDFLEIYGDNIYIDNKRICSVQLLTGNRIKQLMEHASDNILDTLQSFVENTLNYAMKEKKLFFSPIQMPSLNINLKARHVLVVARGKNYKEDLKAIRSYIDEVNPVKIGVDGGADALLEFGWNPDIIVGDMDSVSDIALVKCKQRIVHAYLDGHAPGMERIRKLQLNANIFAFPGTSEDIALLLAYENKAELIVAVGSHTNMIDFLEKGRKGMSSTFLVRMKVGYKIIDAKGVSELYRSKIKFSYIALLLVAALLPLSVVLKTSPIIREFSRLIALRFKILLGL